MNVKKDVKFKIKPSFAFVALCPLVICAYLAACAHAGEQQGIERQDLKKINFTQLADNAETLQKYPFTKDDFAEINAHYVAEKDTQVYVAEIKDTHIKDAFLVYVDGAIECGIYCDFRGYAKTKDGFNKIWDVLARDPVYLQTCPNETSVITTGGSMEPGYPNLSNATQWVYSGGKFEFKATYPGLEDVPTCGANTDAGKRGVNAGPLAVYGEPLKVQPCKTGVPGSNFGWEVIKFYLPPEILQAPTTPMSHRQIVEAVDKRTREASSLADTGIRQLIPVYEKSHRGDKGDPYMELADAFNSGRGAEELPGVNPVQDQSHGESG